MDLKRFEASSLNKKVALFNTYTQKHATKQAANPFSQANVQGMEKRKFSGPEYGKPEKGSQSEYRGLVASLQIQKELLELCDIIAEFGHGQDSQKSIKFGELFDIYTTISNKLVGMLIRARKHQILDFQGEILFQGRDDGVQISLKDNVQDIRKTLKEKVKEIETDMRKSRDILEPRICSDSDSD